MSKFLVDEAAVQQALEALETVFMPHHPAVISLRAVLEQPEPGGVCASCGGWVCDPVFPQPEQEPVAWADYDLDGMAEAFSRVIEAHHSSKHPFHTPIDMDAKMALRILRGLIPAMKAYTHPPRREWRGLTDDEISALFPLPLRSDYKPYSFARAVEAALKEKNT